MSAVEAIRAAGSEVQRCQRNIDLGGSPEFWRRRLTEAAKRYEAAAVILRMQIAMLAPTPRDTTGERP